MAAAIRTRPVNIWPLAKAEFRVATAVTAIRVAIGDGRAVAVARRGLPRQICSVI
jgi:hypothetical protein